MPTLNAHWIHNYAIINDIHMHYVEQRKPFEGVQSDVQAWFIGSEADVDLEGFHGDDPIGLMRAIFPNLIDVQMIPKVGHMIALEASDELNLILLDYLSRITGDKAVLDYIQDD